MTEQSPRILFIINKGSGRKEFDWHAAILEFLKSKPFETGFFFMPVDDCVDRLRVKIKNYGPVLLVAVGGDGTVSLVAKEAIAHNIPMAIIPAGSANGMAKELGIPTDPGALDIMLNGEERATDVIAINKNAICLHLSDLGINAQLIKYFEQGNTRGKLGYGLALIKAITRRRRMKVLVKTKNEELSRSAVMVLIANASQYGTGATINPTGSIYDGEFEVVVVRKLNLREILKMFMKVQRFNPKKIESYRATSVKIETSHRVHFQVDGEYLGKINRVEARVQPGKLRLVVPRGEQL